MYKPQTLSCSRYADGSWSTPTSFAGQTDVSPTGVRLDATLHLFHTGRDNKIYFCVWQGGNWSGWNAFTSATVLPTALSCSPYQQAFALVGIEKVFYTRIEAGVGWTDLRQVAGPLQTTLAPALAYLGTSCYLFYTGLDQKLYYSIVG